MRSDFEPTRIVQAKTKLTEAMEKAALLLEEEKAQERAHLKKYSLFQRFIHWFKGY